MIRFIVPAVPIAQPRQRHRIMQIAGRNIVTNYTPAKAPVNSFKATVLMAARQAYQGPSLQGAVKLRLVFVMPRPKGMIWKSKPMPRVHYVACKNDWDNLGKSVCDALNGYLFRDDGQIVVAHVERWIAAGDEQPHVDVEIEEVTAIALESA